MNLIRLPVIQNEITAFLYGKPSSIGAIKRTAIEHALDREKWVWSERIMPKTSRHEQGGFLKRMVRTTRHALNMEQGAKTVETRLRASSFFISRPGSRQKTPSSVPD